MRKLTALLLLAAATLLTACPGTAPSTGESAPARTLVVTDFGAVPETEATAAIQAAIDSCSRAGGGRVVIPAGRFEARTLYLRDSVELYLEKDAVLAGVADPAAYSAFVTTRDLSRYDSGGGSANANCVSDPEWMKALLIGEGIRGASIGGEGTLDGGHVVNPRGEEGMRGPHTLVIAEAVGFRLSGIRITRAANYAFLGYALEDAVFEQLHITEGWDGIHIRGGKDVSIRDCRFETGDDAIAGGYWEGMRISGCDINSSCNGIRMIMPSDGVTVEDCVFHGPGTYPHRTSGEARRSNMLFGVSLEPGAWGSAPGETRGIVLRDCAFRCLDAPVATSVRADSRAFDLTLEGLSGTELRSANPVVSWLDQGFDSITVRDCQFTR